MDNEEGETIEFYKIKLMEKDSQISNFEAKFKKAEFKYTREIKEAKLGEERATALLKQQKAKVDKITKQAKQNQQLNNMLQMRLNQLKEDKDKQLVQTKSKYNQIKDELRSFERILPTQTFLSQAGISIVQLPTYDDIYIKLNEKEKDIQQLNNKLSTFKLKAQTQIESYQKSDQVLKQKILQSQRNLNQLRSKIMETNKVVKDLESANEHLQKQVTQLNNTIQTERSKNSKLEEYIRENDDKIQQISQAFTSQVLKREEQLKLNFEEERQKLENDLKSSTSRYQIKEKMFLSQISILEQESTNIKSKLQQLAHKYEKDLQEVELEIQQLKEQVQKQRKNYEAKNVQNEANKKFIVGISKTNQQLQIKIRNLVASLKQLEEKRLNAVRNVEYKAQLITIQKQEYVRQRTKTDEIIKRHEDSQKQIEVLAKKNSQFEIQKGKLNQLISNLNDKNKVIQQKLVKYERAFQQMLLEKGSTLKQLGELQTQNQKANQEITALKQKLQKTVGKYESQVNQLNKKINLQNIKIQSLQKQSVLTTEENQKLKQNNKAIREQLKGFQLQRSKILGKITSGEKDKNIQVQLIKQEKDKLLQQLQNKEKQLMNSSNLVQTLKQAQEKLIKQNQESKQKLSQIQQSCLEQQRKLNQSNKEVIRHRKVIEQLQDEKTKSNKELQFVNLSLERERKQRTLRNVPSLQFLNQNSEAQQQNFNQIFQMVSEKEGQINLLQREVSDLKQELQALRLNHQAKLQIIEGQQNQYIQTIISMKMKCAQFQMKANQKQHLYNQLRKKISNQPS